MWILVWLSFMDGQFQYYQLGVYGTEAHCNKEKVKAEVRKATRWAVWWRLR